MQDLRARLSDKGFSDVSFRIINTKSAINDINETGVETLRNFAGDIPVMQEPEDINPSWQAVVEGGTDNILVLDRCGRLAYQVISPWSLLSYPYVKAAILSTYKDDPCGFCNITDTEVLEQASDSPSTELDDTMFAVTLPNPSQTETTPKPLLQTTGYMITESNHLLLDAEGTPSASINIKNETFVDITEIETDLNSETSSEEIIDAPRQQIQYFDDIISNATNIDSSNSEKKTIHSRASSTLETERDKTDNNYLFETGNILAENELDATLSPLAERKDGSVPLRVIMRFPHKHILKNGTVIQHEYLVLQTGNPDYHGHLESEENKNLVLNTDQQQAHKRAEKENVNAMQGRKHHTRKPTETEEVDEAHENTGPKSMEKIRHKGKKYHKKYKSHKSEETKGSDESNEEENREIKKDKGKNKNKIKSYKSMETENGGRSIEEKSDEIGKINQEGLEIPEESKESDEFNLEKSAEKIKNKGPTNSQESRENGSTEEKIKHRGWKNYQSKENEDTMEDESSSSEVSQDIRKHHGKHDFQSSENNTLHFNRIKHVQKSGRNHNKHKLVQIVVGDGNNNTRDHTRKIKVNKKIVVEANRNDTDDNIISKDITVQSERRENGSNQFIKNVEVHKKKYYHKKARISGSENYSTTTPVPIPIPIAWYGANKPIDNARVNSTDRNLHQVHQNRVTEKFKPMHKNIYDTGSNGNRFDDNDEDLQRIDGVDIVTNSENPNTVNKIEEETSDENDDSDVKDENIIQHYSKLLKWIEYPL